MSLTMQTEINDKYHTLNDTWTLWAHLPHDTNWDLNSYKKITDINCIEQILDIEKIFPETMIKNCMLFCMRQNISPTWEDPNNREGGSFSFKINNVDIYKIWNELLMTLLSEMLIKEEILNKNINGITISPKKNFCILKIWMRDISIQNVKLLNIPNIIDSKSTLFKQHNPES
jgi:hypothetical protein